MPDFEDSNCPTWSNLVEGQVRPWGRAGPCVVRAVRMHLPELAHPTLPSPGHPPLLQMNLYDAVRRTISLSAPGGKTYRLKERVAVMLVRPRG